MQANLERGLPIGKDRRSMFPFSYETTRGAVAEDGGRAYLDAVHELSLAESLHALVIERTGRARVRRIRIEVGRWLAVVPDALRLCFEVVAKGSPLEEARLEICEVPVRGRCGSCGWEGEPAGPFLLCPSCLQELELAAGRELRIREVEVI